MSMYSIYYGRKLISCGSLQDIEMNCCTKLSIKSIVFTNIK